MPTGAEDFTFDRDSEKIAYKFVGATEDDNWIVVSDANSSGAVAAAEMVQDTLAEKDRQLLAELNEKARSLQEAVVQAERAIHQMTRDALQGARQEIVMLKGVRSGTTIQLGEQKMRVRHSIFKPRIAQRREDRVRILPLGEGNMPEE